VVLENNHLFLGASVCESLLLHCNKPGQHAGRKRSHAEYEDDEASPNEAKNEEEDDIYGFDGATDERSTLDNVGSSLDNVSFTILDRLPTLAPMGPITVSEQKHTSGSSETSLVLAASVGCGRGSKIALLTQLLHPSRSLNLENISNATGVWRVKPGKVIPQLKGASGESSDDVDVDELLVVSSGSGENDEASAIFSVTKDGLKARTGTNFEEDTPTLDVGTLLSGSVIVQVTHTQLNCYDAGKSSFPSPLIMIELSLLSRYTAPIQRWIYGVGAESICVKQTSPKLCVFHRICTVLYYRIKIIQTKKCYSSSFPFKCSHARMLTNACPSKILVSRRCTQCLTK